MALELDGGACAGFQGNRFERLFPCSMLATGWPDLMGEGFGEAASPNADEKGCSEEEYGIEAGPRRPIGGIFEAKPESEFVEGKSGAHTVEQGHKTARQKR